MQLHCSSHTQDRGGESDLIGELNLSVQVKSLEIDAVKIIKPDKHGDNRGFFSEVYNKEQFCEVGIDLNFVQDNHSFSAEAGTLRGLHYQGGDAAQDKLVRCVRGRILDVAVDLRKGSPTFGEWVSAEISAENWEQILVPVGFAHGILTLEPNTEIIYKVTNYYSPSLDFGVRWDDPDLGIEWGVSKDKIILSEKDKKQPFFNELTHWFSY